MLEEVWGGKARDKSHYLRIYMASIRRKVEPDPVHPRYFLTSQGSGCSSSPKATAATMSATSLSRSEPGCQP
jgi:two-component system KDP operon response regulator KdpE